jgi:hypothetical protein
MFAPQVSKIRNPSGPSIATRAKSLMLRGQAGRGDQGFELQMPYPESGRFGRYRWPADVVGRRVRQDLIDDTRAVEADHHDQPPGTVDGW